MKGIKVTQLDSIARAELSAYYQKAWDERRQNLWPAFPLRPKDLETLVRASLSHKTACKGGFVNEFGRRNHRSLYSACNLEHANMLIPDTSMPTELGWSMLEKFAADIARFPENYKPTVPEHQRQASHMSLFKSRRPLSDEEQQRRKRMRAYINKPYGAALEHSIKTKTALR
jgi:hypothetical protein